MAINIAVKINNKANKYSTINLIVLFFTNSLITDPNAAQGVIESVQITNAVNEIKKIDINKNSSFGKKLAAAILAVVQAFGLTI